MSKYMHKFATVADFEEVYYSSAYTQPWLSCVVGEDGVVYNKFNTNGYEYVDLGLPSGTLWAKMNVGASNIDDPGDFFAWGEISPKSAYTFNNYKWYDEGNGCFTKYTEGDELSFMEPEDDAARANMGGEWHMPSLAQVQELLANTNKRTHFDAQMNKLYTIFTSTINGKTLKFPYAPIRDDEEEEEPLNNTYVMTSNLTWEEEANYLVADGSPNIEVNSRYLGANVRGVIGFELLELW